MMDPALRLVSMGPTAAFCIRSDDTSDYIAAVIVKPFWGAPHVKTLWTHKDHRQKGLATQLMHKAYEFALEQKLAFLFVETFSFQALEFYRDKMGYALEFTRHGYAGGASFHYLRKDVVSNATKNEEQK